ncbi:MAG: heavy-metal-associated domain-containing protein [Nitrospira sp.]|jgi:mercuric ion binding protein|nr:heavy-metal-associated domain-containing protein [Nitrospira sp.]
MWRQFGLVVLISAMTVGVAVHSGLAAENQGVQTVTLQIDGMTCGACVKDVKAALAKVPGVSTVEFRVGTKWGLFSDYSDARASVTFDANKVGTEALVKAIEGASSPLSAYKARLVQP